ncbi:FASCICLIN-LIKE ARABINOGALACTAN PROTEIN 3 [Salix koriyanagi]|uniref:FASCICLIN-LIKE ARABINOGALACTAN PROTEIN 3 n=1 Tax=Salix koriyanagi TaxID=2511006 RepID=A0A9Q0SB24_9ROSI|nr:FASCICLIN-LIKE ARABINOGALACTAN PROTEIN 3 [Salix koriyanagi]
MDSKVSSLLFIAILCLLSSTSTAFNITKILAQYPEFASFNDLLAQSGLAQEINGRETITVLALDNGSIDGLSGRPVDIAKRILSAHVILDYYDQIKLSKLQKASTIVTTLFQASGIADDRQGFLNISKTAEGIKFGSAMKGAPLVASLVKSVYAQPYNISVLQVSEPIEAPGIENMAPPPPPAAVPKKAPAPAPAAKTPSKAPAPSKVEPSTPTESPTEGPVAADVPAASPLADAPLADEAPAKAASSQMHVGGAVVVVGLLACMVGF